MGPYSGSLGHNGTNGTLPAGCVALFSLALINELGVDLNWHSQNCVEGPAPPRLRKRDGNPMATTINVSEVKVREFLQRNAEKEALETKSASSRVTLEPWQQVDVNTDMSIDSQRKVWGLLEKHKHVFLGSKQLPPVMAGGPHKFILKPNVKPVSCPEPRWSPAKAEYVDLWAEEGLKSGLLEPAPFSQWASRVHIALKPPDGLRPCVEASCQGQRLYCQNRPKGAISQCPSFGMEKL